MKKLLLVIDFQNDFVSGSLGFEGAEKLDDLIAEKIRQYRSNNYDVAFTFDTHNSDYLDTQEGKMLSIPHCIYGTEGWQLYGEVSRLIESGDKRFIKPTFGSFELGEYLKENEYDEIELVGLVTNICVISNAVIAKTALPQARIVIDENCVSSYDKSLHDKALDVMEGLQIVISRTDKQ